MNHFEAGIIKTGICSEQIPGWRRAWSCIPRENWEGLEGQNEGKRVWGSLGWGNWDWEQSRDAALGQKTGMIPREIWAWFGTEQGKWDKDMSGMEGMGSGPGVQKIGRIPKERWSGGAERGIWGSLGWRGRGNKDGEVDANQRCSPVEKIGMIPRENWAGKAQMVRAWKEGIWDLQDGDDGKFVLGKPG